MSSPRKVSSLCIGEKYIQARYCVTLRQLILYNCKRGNPLRNATVIIFKMGPYLFCQKASKVYIHCMYVVFPLSDH